MMQARTIDEPKTGEHAMIEFEDAGARFRISGSEEEGWEVRASCGPNSPEPRTVADWSEACDFVDETILARSPEGATRFGGYVLTWRNHEGGGIEERRLTTRGDVLSAFPDGRIPSPDDLVDLVEKASGDRLLTVADPRGRVLVDRTAIVEHEDEAFEEICAGP